MKTVVFAWELGRGLGHLMNMCRIARRLTPHGVRAIAAIVDPSSAEPFRKAFGEIIRAPQWPLHSRPPRSARPFSSATLNDILSGAGLCDGAAVDRLLGARDELFRTARPDLVIADFAPLAALAARGRIPARYRQWLYPATAGNAALSPPASARAAGVERGANARDDQRSSTAARVDDAGAPPPALFGRCLPRSELPLARSLRHAANARLGRADLDRMPGRGRPAQAPSSPICPGATCRIPRSSMR